MIYSLTGELAVSEPGMVVIVCGGVGFKCSVSGSTLRSLPAVGQQTTLYTHLSVSQDAMSLYGFSSRTELSCFKMLTSVSGIGSKTAIAVLSAISPEQLAVCVAAGDYKTLTLAQGIGPKQAQRIVLELKDKVAAIGAAADSFAAGGAVSPVGLGGGEAQKALMVLGYSAGEAASLLSQLDQSLPVEQLIAQALKLRASDL